ncbi:MAG: nucleotidyltransferase domain-containing protein [Pirellulaceae bacterium]
MSIDARCSVVLIGSVARGEQRTRSDLDLNLIFPGDECPLGRHPYVAEDNRWQLQVKDQIEGVRIDVAWETEHALLGRLRGDDVVNCRPFSQGRVLHDPGGIATTCLDMVKTWFAEHPEIASRFEASLAETKAKQLRSRGEL